MKVIKTIVWVVIGLAVAGTAGLAFLGHSSQNGTASGLVNGELAPCPDAPNCVSSEQGTLAEKRVNTLEVRDWEALPRVIGEMGGVVTIEDEAYIAAEFTSATFGFVDDLELRKADDAVHVRSASRVGHSDAGVNAARVENLRAMLGG